MIKKKRLQSLIEKIRHQKFNKSLIKISFNKRCLICIDLDGTLLDNNSKISLYSTKVIQKLSSLGHIVCIFTGRPKRSSYDYYHQLQLKTPLVNYNGAMVHNPYDNEFATLCFYINTEVIYKIFSNKKILDLCQNVIFETSNGTCLLKELESNTTEKAIRKSLAKFNIHTTKNISYLSNDFAKLKNGVWAILISLKDMSKARQLCQEIASISSNVYAREWTEKHIGTIIELNSAFPSKGMALKYLSIYYDIPLNRCYCFGDNNNDIEMLSLASHSYAMKNGTILAKKAAKHITKFTNNEDGVAYELKRIFKLI